MPIENLEILGQKAYFEAFVDQLMCPRDQFETINMVELSSNFVPKQPSRSSRTHCPCAHLFRITPYQIAESTLMGDLLRSCNDPDLIHGSYLGAQPTMYTEYFADNHCAEVEEGKNLTAGFPYRSIAVLLLAFFVESVDLGDLSRLVIAADEGYAVRISLMGN